AKAFVLKLFMIGMSSTSRVESYNAKLKRLIFNFNMIILELAKKLIACVLEEDKKQNMLYSVRRSNKAIPSVLRYDSVLERIAEIFYIK
ncbi:29423_t:CDS:2, partial [Gigaspora margarita]